MLRRIFLLLFATALFGCGLVGDGIDKFDTMVVKDQECNRAWADVEAQYQRRFDMIPNLVKVVKTAASHEKGTLTAVTEARAKATKVTLSADDVKDPAKLAQFQAAQDELSRSLGKLMMVQESYPELKANKNFENLMVQIEGTENRILFARKRFNEAVGDYNTELRRFGGRVVNKATGEEFTVRPFFKASSGAEKAPDIEL